LAKTSGRIGQDLLKLIAGPTVFICDECVQTCADIIAADEPPNALPESSQMIPREGEVSCSLCGRPASPDMMLWVENRGLLCGDCANAVEDALNRERPTS
jgi:hypothetical protein